MSSKARIVLLETDGDVIRDVTCSLRLINIPVETASTVQAALEALSRGTPDLLLVRSRTKEEGETAVKLLEEAAACETDSAVRIVVICTPSERSSLEGRLSEFHGEIALPVEFPHFGERVLELLAADRRPAAAAGVKASPAPASEALAPVTNRMNLLAVYDIQLTVLERLRAEGLAGADALQIPELVAEATQQVCAEFDVDKFYSKGDDQ